MDPSVIISLLSLAGVVVFGVLTAVHNSGGDVRQQLEDAKREAATNAKIETSLDSIKVDTAEIRTEQRSLRTDMAEYNRRLTVVEQSTKSAHHRLDHVDDVLNIQHREGSEYIDKLEG